MSKRDGCENKKNKADSDEAEMDRLCAMGNQQRNLFQPRETFNDYYRTSVKMEIV